MFGTGVADYALEPRYAELLWEVSAEMVAAEKYALRFPRCGRHGSCYE